MRSFILSFSLLFLLGSLSLAHSLDQSTHVWLGVIVEEVSPEKLDDFGLEYGVEVKKVISESPAEEAGIKRGDIILKINDHMVYSPKRLRWIIEHSPVEKEIPVLIYRNNQKRELTVQMRKLYSDWGPYFHHFRLPGQHRSYLGVKLQSLTAELRNYFGVKDNLGVLVASVKEDSPAKKAGIQAGDVIIRMDRRRIRSVRDVHRVLAFFEPGEEIEIQIVRNGEKRSVKVKLGKTRKIYPKTYFYWDEGLEDLEIEIDPESIKKAMEILRENLSKLNDYLENLEEDCEDLRED